MLRVHLDRLDFVNRSLHSKEILFEEMGCKSKKLHGAMTIYLIRQQRESADCGSDSSRYRFSPSSMILKGPSITEDVLVEKRSDSLQPVQFSFDFSIFSSDPSSIS